MEKFGIELKWAALATLLSCVWAFGEKQLGMHQDFSNGFTSLMLFYLVQSLMIFGAFIDKKKNYFENNWSFGQAFKFGMFLTGMLTILSPLAQYIIYTSISPDYFSNIIAYRSAKYPESATNFAEYYTLESQIRQSVQSALSIGIVFSALFAYILKTKNYEPKQHTKN